MHSLKAIVPIVVLVHGVLFAAGVAAADTVPGDADAAKTDERKSTGAAGQFEYELRTEEASVLDDRFPFGYWEVTRVYPEILSETHPSVAEAANGRISALIDQYRCDGLGDQSFRTQEVYLGTGILSIAYEATWMCASMEAPDGESGSLNLDLADGTDVKLEDQFRGPSDYAQFRSQAVQELNRELENQVAESGEPCPQVRAFSGFHTDGTDLTVSSMSDQEGFAACHVRVSFPLKSLERQLRADSVLLSAAQTPGVP